MDNFESFFSPGYPWQLEKKHEENVIFWAANSGRVVTVRELLLSSRRT